MGHFTPESGNADDVAYNGIITFLGTKYQSTENLWAVSCDDTPVNTGSLGGGTITKVENKLNKN